MNCILSYRPDTAGYIQKMEREREAREKGDFKDNRSFLAKYVSNIRNNQINFRVIIVINVFIILQWMYIIPVAIFLLISGAANPDQGGGR